ncbi:RNA polymerase sigma factor [Paenibacillus alginolyticus]|uniref:RNA polymerase sigma factor n=1 Tax=Paenibacillus alginolyticus TaxID=59839 RepID=A0ABT4GQ99_9BACL|nr:RNA polymerase sigma factor [Paenibacillus alginolyticus]MCY9698415.1 RNA polymerase sigma factor [Paenibacillus alginolyticus]MEC0143703.1 RNA polymerase sigma factor [Paenibacillus alginolyticus]
MEEIIKRCKQGDMEGFGLLFKNYSRTIHQTSYLITRNNSLADDITQETIVHLFSNIQQYKDQYPFENWLFRVTVNVTKNALRKQNGVLGWKRTASLLFEKEIDNNTPEEILQQKEIKTEMLDQITLLLPYKIRIVIVLKYFNGLSQEEIANVLNVPVGTVKWRIHQALLKLRSKMNQERCFRKAAVTHE